jgi:hypothetical protein
VGCDSPLRGFKDIETGGLTFRREKRDGKMEVACGGCLGCRLDHSRMWAMRIVHEASMHELNRGNCFVTLTYRDENDCTWEQKEENLYVPNDWSLHKSHVQLFLKRLRKRFKNEEIRYFYAGEYGRKCKHGLDLRITDCPLCNTGRPHFHLCLFNCSFDDLVSYQSDNGIMRYTSPSLESLWGFGFVDVGDLNFASASYTARYILKKVKSVKSDYHYCTYDMDGVITWIEPEFIGMSTGKTCPEHKGMPYQVDCPNCSRGLGADWLYKYWRDIYPSDEVPVPGKGVINGVPRYYDKLMKEIDPDLLDQVKGKRIRALIENADEYEHGRLMSKHICKKARLELFGRKEIV